MTVPPPYDPVLLREHAFRDTGLTSLVITPGTNDGAFHAVAEKGLGLFSYRFAEHFKVDKAYSTFEAVRLVNILLALSLITIVYYTVDNIFEKFSDKRPQSSMSMVQERLLSPFSLRSSTIIEDIESSPELHHASLFEGDYLHTPQAASVPKLSNSLTNTPSSPDPYENFDIHGYDNSKLLNFIESDSMHYTKIQKIH